LLVAPGSAWAGSIITAAPKYGRWCRDPMGVATSDTDEQGNQKSYAVEASASY
jgi:hypothetical protein